MTRPHSDLDTRFATKQRGLDLGKRLKAKRVEDGISLRDLAAIVGVSFSGLARMERGIGGYTPDTIERVTRWIEAGEGSERKEPRVRSWFMTMEQRVARIEAMLGLQDLVANERLREGSK